MNNDVCVIRAKLKKDYVYDAIQHYGYPIHTPYKGNNLFLRILREIWFRCGLPKKEIWFNKSKDNRQYKNIVIYDPLIMPEYIEWIHKQYPKSKLLLSYENRAEKTIHPDSVPCYVTKWSYDKDDCKKFSMNWFEPSYFMEYKRKRKDNPKYDVLYVGRDKGRAEYLLEFEKQLKGYGLKTYFHICADRQFMEFKKKYYKKLLTYDEYLELLVDTKAILNIVPEGQKSVTQREMEAAFDGIKCITNNRGVKQFELYDPSIYFVLGEDDLGNIKDFISSDVIKIKEEVLQKYDYGVRMKEIIG